MPLDMFTCPLFKVMRKEEGGRMSQKREKKIRKLVRKGGRDYLMDIRG